jgi:hypothetical protein
MEGYLIYENGKPRESQATRFRCHYLYLDRAEAEDICRNLASKFRSSRFELVLVVTTPKNGTLA